MNIEKLFKIMCSIPKLRFHWTYHVVPDEISEVSEFSLFRSCTMLKSANFEKSVFPCPISLADFRDSISLTSSNFFLTSSPPFYKRRSNVSLEDMVLYRHTRTLEFFWILSKNIAIPKLSKEKYLCKKYWIQKNIFPVRLWFYP